jgi:hypothetical protein
MQAIFAQFDHDGITGVAPKFATEGGRDDELTTINDFDSLRSHGNYPHQDRERVAYLMA